MGAPSAPVIPGAGGRCIRTREHERLAGGYKGVTFMTKQNKKHRARHRGRHVQLYAYFATAVEAAKAFDGAVRRTIEVHKNLSYSGPLSDKQGYMFRAMLQIINFPTTEEKAFMRNYEQNWRRKPFELRLEDSESPRSRRRMRENRTSWHSRRLYANCRRTGAYCRRRRREWRRLRVSVTQVFPLQHESHL